jgi:hypothetical protein
MYDCKGKPLFEVCLYYLEQAGAYSHNTVMIVVFLEQGSWKGKLVFGRNEAYAKDGYRTETST